MIIGDDYFKSVPSIKMRDRIRLIFKPLKVSYDDGLYIYFKVDNKGRVYVYDIISDMFK